jgi:hypothetical protein
MDSPATEPSKNPKGNTPITHLEPITLLIGEYIMAVLFVKNAPRKLEPNNADILSTGGPSAGTPRPASLDREWYRTSKKARWLEGAHTRY